MTETPPTDAEVMLSVAALKVLAEYTADQYDKARRAAAGRMNPGDRRQVVVEGEDIAMVLRSKPSPKSIVTDRTLLTAWMEERYPDSIESGYGIAGSDHQVIELLLVHAPHLLSRKRRVKNEALAQLHSDAIRLRVPVGPSGEVDVPGLTVEMGDPVVSCRPDKDIALLTILSMVHNGRLHLDGSRPELEAAE